MKPPSQKHARNTAKTHRALRRLARRALLLASTAAVGCATIGCHNKDRRITRQVAWKCPLIQPREHLPRKVDDEGRISPWYKKATAVRFTFLEAPDQYFDLYQPGLCDDLGSQKLQSLPMIFALTSSPKGKLLSYEAVSIGDRSLSTGEQLGSTLYLEDEKKDMLAKDKGKQLQRDQEFDPRDPVPARHLPADQLLR